MALPSRKKATAIKSRYGRTRNAPRGIFFQGTATETTSRSPLNARAVTSGGSVNNSGCKNAIRAAAKAIVRVKGSWARKIRVPNVRSWKWRRMNGVTTSAIGFAVVWLKVLSIIHCLQAMPAFGVCGALSWWSGEKSRSQRLRGAQAMLTMMPYCR